MVARCGCFLSPRGGDPTVVRKFGLPFEAEARIDIGREEQRAAHAHIPSNWIYVQRLQPLSHLVSPVTVPEICQVDLGRVRYPDLWMAAGRGGGGGGGHVNLGVFRLGGRRQLRLSLRGVGALIHTVTAPSLSPSPSLSLSRTHSPKSNEFTLCPTVTCGSSTGRGRWPLRPAAAK